MNPPRSAETDAPDAEAPFEPPISAVGARRLVELLEEDGLTGSTNRELSRPESVASLRELLTGSDIEPLERDVAVRSP